MISKKKQEFLNKIRTVNVLGVRQAKETKILGTYNYPMYTLLVEYKDNGREIFECDINELQDYCYYIPMTY